jgi:hypothetical protein
MLEGVRSTVTAADLAHELSGTTDHFVEVLDDQAVMRAVEALTEFFQPLRREWTIGLAIRSSVYRSEVRKRSVTVAGRRCARRSASLPASLRALADLGSRDRLSSYRLLVGTYPSHGRLCLASESRCGKRQIKTSPAGSRALGTIFFVS